MCVRRRGARARSGTPLTASARHALEAALTLAFKRASASLSKLSGHRVRLDAPRISLCPIEAIDEHVRPVARDVASVHQTFGGRVVGEAFLILGRRAASVLTERLTTERAMPLEIDASAREVVLEVGNVLLNACLDAVAGLLHADVVFAAPHLRIERLENLREAIVAARGGASALVARTAFQVHATSLAAVVVVTLDAKSSDRLMRAINARPKR